MKIVRLMETNSDKIKIIIKNNKDCIIKDNIIYFQGNTTKYYNPDIKVDFSLRETAEYSELLYRKQTMYGALSRNVFLEDTINRFIHISKVNGYEPTVRICGYFTSLSSIRQKSENSDLALLELEEKNNLINMVKLGFKVKLILILDARTILTLGYTLEQYNERCQDLYRSIKMLEVKYPNLEIVVNDKNNITCGYIFDSILLVQTDKYDLNSFTLNYNKTEIDSRKIVLENEIKIFDENFNRLSLAMKGINQMLQSGNISESVLNISQIRRDNYLKTDK